MIVKVLEKYILLYELEYVRKFKNFFYDKTDKFVLLKYEEDTGGN